MDDAEDELLVALVRLAKLEGADENCRKCLWCTAQNFLQVGPMHAVDCNVPATLKRKKPYWWRKSSLSEEK